MEELVLDMYLTNNWKKIFTFISYWFKKSIITLLFITTVRTLSRTVSTLFHQSRCYQIIKCEDLFDQDVKYFV